MAISVTYTPNELADGQQFKGTKVYIGSIAGPANYTTSGFTAEAVNDFELAGLAAIQSSVITSDAGYTASFNADHDKILVFDGATQVSAAVNLSAVEFTIHLFANNGTL